MTKFTPKTKLSKKKRKELNSQQRVTWDMNPVTRTAPDKKKYNRKKFRMPDGYADFSFCFVGWKIG